MNIYSVIHGHCHINLRSLKFFLGKFKIYMKNLSFQLIIVWYLAGQVFLIPHIQLKGIIFE